MTAGQVPRLGARDSIQATFMRAMLAPLWPLFLLGVAISRGVGMVVFLVLFVLLLGVAGTSLVTALSPGLSLYGNRSRSAASRTVARARGERSTSPPSPT